MKHIVIALGLMIAGSLMLSVVQATPASAACGGNILTLKPWYDGLTKSDCNLKAIVDNNDKRAQNDPGNYATLNGFIWRAILNVVEDLLQLAGFVTVGFVIYGGFLYLTSNGEPGQMANGMKTVINATIGLVIAIASVALVNVVADGLGLPRS